MKKILIWIAATLALTGCGKEPAKPDVQTVEQKRYRDCLNNFGTAGGSMSQMAKACEHLRPNQQQ
jgi:Prokaryotic membrane lipoprotein lipid attachment site